ncbi:fimbrial protein [Escherichia coli]|nr:fimbrial protein [Escherichia coli]EHD2967583.1 fimbrial protein [Escherichia coli]EJZ1815321.1 fimbrial protein [Escherichia coli]EKM4467399.1 fimbrial protein [Escherichia coli]ELA5611769.1 fimbrial protein [Escherichia coli]
MIKLSPCQLVMLTGILLSPSAFATDINVDFTATVKATTCNITLTGTNVTDNKNNKYTLVIPSMGMDKIANKTVQSEANFKLVAIENTCSSGISWIDTTLTGNQFGNSTLIIPLDSDTTSTTRNIGMGFKRKATSGDTFLKPNGAEYIRWSASEISTDGLEMTVALRETTTGQGVPGKFRALATFNFSYQ